MASALGWPPPAAAGSLPPAVPAVASVFPPEPRHRLSREGSGPVTGQGTLGHTISGQGPRADAAPARTERIARLKKNAQFRQVAKGTRFHSRSFSLQAAGRAQATAGGPRVGFTVTRKTGGAVERNRMRRRLREALRLTPDLCTAPDHDYVLVIRREALTTPFAELVGELTRAFRDIASRKRRRTRAVAERQPATRIDT
jgi:ribonuclease P protein component